MVATSPGYSFEPSNLVDGNLSTSWQPKLAKGAWVRLEFQSELEVISVSIANGFQAQDRLGDQFVLNSRIAKARLRFSDNSDVLIFFSPDARGLVRFDVPRKATRTVTLLVDSLHAGTRWNDLAISEIEVHVAPASGQQ